MSSISHDPAVVRTAAHDVGAVGAQLSNAWAAFSGRVAAMGDIFGDDPVGGLIGASYRAAHAIAERSFSSVSQALHGFAAGLTTTADRYAQREQDVCDRFDGLGG